MTIVMEILNAAILEEEEFVRAILAEQADLEATIADGEFEDIEDMEAFHAWLDSLEPVCGELEARDLAGSWDFGHAA